MTAIRSSHKVIKPWKHSINCEGGHNCGCVMQKESMSAVRSSSFDLPENEWSLPKSHLEMAKELEESIYGKPKPVYDPKWLVGPSKQFEETKVGDVSVVVETPTLDHALSIFAFHISVIAKCADGGAVYFYGGVSMCWEITRSEDDPTLLEETNRDWDQFFIDGSKSAIGNRCAARNEYVKRCVPVLMRIANGEMK